MDDLSQDLDRLFSQSSADLDSEAELEARLPGAGPVGYARCKCGQMFSLAMPGKCPGCQEPKSWWKTGDGKVLKISQMTIGHLTSSIKYLAEKMEKALVIHREPYEIALDLLYAELGSRDKETNQLTGIQAALFKSLK